MVYVEARTKPNTLKEGTQEQPVAREPIMLNARPRVSVIIPALNEAENIPHVIAQVPEWVHEVVLVDGFSTDGTTEVAQRVWPNHHIVMQERRHGTERRNASREERSDRRGPGRALRLVQQTRRGKGNALHSGIAAATGEIIVMMDADGSTDPQEIGRFVDTLVDGADFAKGSRFLRNAGTYDMPRYRQLGNWGLVFLTNVLFGTRYTDITYGYNAFWKRHAGALALEIDGWPNEIISNIRVARHGLRVQEVPSFEHPRLAGEAKLQGVFGVGWQIGREILRERCRPARMQTLMSASNATSSVDVTVSDDTITLRPEGDLAPATTA